MSSLWSHWSEERTIVGRFICQINGSDKCCRCVGRETFSTLTYLKFVSILCLSQMNVANLLGEGSLRTSPCRNFHLCRWYRLSLRFGMVNMITVARRSPSVVLLFQVTLTECEAIRFPTSNNWPRLLVGNWNVLTQFSNVTMTRSVNVSPLSYGAWFRVPLWMLVWWRVQMIGWSIWWGENISEELWKREVEDLFGDTIIISTRSGMRACGLYLNIADNNGWRWNGDHWAGRRRRNLLYSGDGVTPLSL